MRVSTCVPAYARAKYADRPIEPITDGSRRDLQNEHDGAIHDINRSECTRLGQ